MPISAMTMSGMACKSLIATPAATASAAARIFPGGPATRHLGRAAPLRQNVLRAPLPGSSGPSARPCAARATSSGRDPFTMDPFSDPYSDPFTMASDFESSVNSQIRKIEAGVWRDMEQTQREIEAAKREIGQGGSGSEVVVRDDQGSFYSRSYSMQRGNGYFMESYTEYRGPGTATMLQPSAAPGSVWGSAILGLALLLTAAYTAAAMAFNRGYQATKFSEKPIHRLRMVLLWPLLYVFSAEFRKEFKAALQQRKESKDAVDVRPGEEDGDNSGSGKLA